MCDRKPPLTLRLQIVGEIKRLISLSCREVGGRGWHHTWFILAVAPSSSACGIPFTGFQLTRKERGKVKDRHTSSTVGLYLQVKFSNSVAISLPGLVPWPYLTAKEAG